MKRIIRKLKSSAGFTLAETLLAVIILLLASAVVAGGMPAALSAYRNAVDGANAQVILSATVNALRDELTTARDVKADGTNITYYSADTGSRSKIYMENNKIMLQEYDDFDDTNGFLDDDASTVAGRKPDARALVTDALTRTTKDGSLMIVSYSDVSVSDGVVTITGLKVERGTGNTIAEMPAAGLVIRVLSEEKTGGGGT